MWSALGHCYLMQDDLQKAYTAYQQALYHLPNPKVRSTRGVPWLMLILCTYTGSQALVRHRHPL